MNKGKNFSGNSNKDRPNSDHYPTPPSMIVQLLEKEVFNKNRSIIEPCCGQYNSIVNVLNKEEFTNITAYDKYFGDNRKDFLSETNRYDYCITNPPFKLAKEFILKLKDIIDSKFCLLLPLSYLHGQWRYENIYQDFKFPLSKVYVFTRYPMLSEHYREDGKYSTGFMVYGWFIWSKNHGGKPIIDWIDNNQYVIGSKGKKKLDDTIELF